MTAVATSIDIGLHEQINRIQSRLQSLRGGPDSKDFDTRLMELEERLQSSRDRLFQTRDVLEGWLEVDTCAVVDASDAEQLDDYRQQSTACRKRADAALNVALDALDEAEHALLSAAVASDTAVAISEA